TRRSSDLHNASIKSSSTASSSSLFSLYLDILSSYSSIPLKTSSIGTFICTSKTESLNNAISLSSKVKSKYSFVSLYTESSAYINSSLVSLWPLTSTFSYYFKKSSISLLLTSLLINIDKYIVTSPPSALSTIGYPIFNPSIFLNPSVSLV